MKVIKVRNTPFDSTGYIVVSDSGNCLIIDLGADFSVFQKVISDNNLTLKAVLLTHCHYDHVNGVKSARENGIDVYISKDDAKSIETSTGTLSKYVNISYQPIFDYKVIDSDVLSFGDITVKVIETPGHTKGSVCYLIGNNLFSGDTLFHMTVGRCDLPSGSSSDMKKSINGLIALLFDESVDYNVYPGHGKSTTFRYEYYNNPYLNCNDNDDLY